MRVTKITYVIFLLIPISYAAAFYDDWAYHGYNDVYLMIFLFVLFLMGIISIIIGKKEATYPVDTHPQKSFEYLESTTKSTPQPTKIEPNVQNIYYYGDNVGTQVKDSIVQRSVVGDNATKICPECGREIIYDDKFCSGCGAKLE